jgi:hypothetical protein
LEEEGKVDITVGNHTVLSLQPGEMRRTPVNCWDALNVSAKTSQRR